MASIRCADLQSRPTEFLDCTSLTLDAFHQLVPPFEAAFQAHMTAWRLAGKPRTARQFRGYTNCPLPTPEDRLLFMLAYVKTYSLQVVQGRLFGMGQSKAHPWMHVLLPGLLAARRALGDAPARSLTALAQRLGGSEADAATMVVPLAEEPVPVATGPASPLVPMPGRNGASSAPKTLLHSKSVRAASKRTIRSKISCWSMPCSSSSSAVTPLAAASLRSRWPTRRRIPGPPGVGCDRLGASWRSRCPTWQFSCRPRSHAARSGHGSSTGPTRPCTVAGSGSSMSTAV
jgi:Helix-turn-helix of DDE superfamily endonuclease